MNLPVKRRVGLFAYNWDNCLKKRDYAARSGVPINVAGVSKNHTFCERRHEAENDVICGDGLTAYPPRSKIGAA